MMTNTIALLVNEIVPQDSRNLLKAQKENQNSI